MFIEDALIFKIYVVSSYYFYTLFNLLGLGLQVDLILIGEYLYPKLKFLYLNKAIFKLFLKNYLQFGF